MARNQMDFTTNNSFDQNYFNNDISSSTDFVMQQTEVIQKRKNSGYRYGEPPSKRSAPSIQVGGGFKWNLQALSQAANAVQSGGKSPVSALNELGVRVSYSILRQSGPAHCPSFTVAVTVADMTFEGWGHSKREARASAARSCLSALLARAGRVLPNVNQSARDVASEFQFIEVKAKQTHQNNQKAVTSSPDNSTPTVPAPAPQPTSTESQVSPVTSLFGAPAIPSNMKSAINLLYENYPGVTFQCSHGDGSCLDDSNPSAQLNHSMRFKVACQIKDHTFEGYGSSKKLAKLAAARSALCALDTKPTSGAAYPLTTVVAHEGGTNQQLYDRIAKLVNEKFAELMRGDMVHSKRKVLAGIVITENDDPDTCRVIAVTTGTKCISGGHMSVRGLCVNDCHAEVVARRCLQKYLYTQLAKYVDDPYTDRPDSDVEPAPGSGYRLKPHLNVHLYVSTAPCGDSRIFSPHETQRDRHPNRLARGQLRTKIESGEGTIPVKNSDNVMQTWDGVMQGERLLTMSCSDKVARWCVLGVQGSLLGCLLQPIYMRTVVLGSLLHPDHMCRAVYGRIEHHIGALPPPFRLHRPILAAAASTEPRTPARAACYSVAWTCTDQTPEIINSMTGKLENGQPSLLCKQSMFARWMYLVKRLPLVPQESGEPRPTPEVIHNSDNLLYNEAKMLCPGYQTARTRLFKAFDTAKLGQWVKKPIEQDQFVCELSDADPKALFA